MAKRFDRDGLLNLPHTDVRASYQAMFGEAPRSPNKVWMVNQMEERHATRAAASSGQQTAAQTRRRTRPESAADAVATEAPLRERGRFRGMTVEELRTLYEQTVGRSTSSVDKPYLIWKILQAEKGKIRVGRVAPGQRREGAFADADKTLPLTLTAAAVAAVDGAWVRTGFPSRMSFLRAAIREALLHRGETDAAAHFPDAGSAHG
jgi:hypothetical protein